MCRPPLNSMSPWMRVSAPTNVPVAARRRSLVLNIGDPSLMVVVAARGRPVERVRHGLAARRARPHLDLDRDRLETDRQHELLLEPLEVAETVLELRASVAGELRETELLGRTVAPAGDAQSYNAFDAAVLRDRLHQHDPHDITSLGSRRRDLHALHPEARLAVGRLDDPAIERELLLLGLKLRLERGQRLLDAGIRLPIHLARRRDDRELESEFLDRLRRLGDEIPLTLDLAAVLEQRVARLMTPELEDQIPRRENQD